MNEHASTTSVRPVDTVVSAVRHIPGAGAVGGMVDGMLGTVGIVSPRARRIAAYTGAGLLGAFGAVDWPVAVAGAAAVWLTQARPAPSGAQAGTATARPAGSSGTRTGRTTARTTSGTSRTPKTSGSGSTATRKTAARKTTARKTAARAASGTAPTTAAKSRTAGSRSASGRRRTT